MQVVANSEATRLVASLYLSRIMGSDVPPALRALGIAPAAGPRRYRRCGLPRSPSQASLQQDWMDADR